MFIHNNMNLSMNLLVINKFWNFHHIPSRWHWRTYLLAWTFKTQHFFIKEGILFVGQPKSIKKQKRNMYCCFNCKSFSVCFQCLSKHNKEMENTKQNMIYSWTSVMSPCLSGFPFHITSHVSKLKQIAKQ